MGLLSIVLGVVGIAAAVASGGTLGLLAAGILAVGVASQAGLIGGSVGNFMKSTGGTLLMAAVSLGSAGAAMYGSSALNAGTTEAQAAVNAASSNAIDTTALDASNAASVADNAAATTGNSFLTSTDAGSDVSSIQAADPALAEATGTAPQSLNAVNNAAPAQGGLGAQAGQAAQAANNSDINAVQTVAGRTSGPGLGGTTQLGAPTTGDVPASMGGAGSDNVPTGVAAQNAAVAPTASANAPMTMPDGSAIPNPNALTSDATVGPSAAPDNSMGAAGAQPGSGGSPGYMQSVKNFLGGNGNPFAPSPTTALIQAGGSLISGVGQGIAQKQAIEDQIKASQYGNLSYNNAGEVNQLESAAAAPITVPSGYLARAQQVKNLMAGFNNGIQPAPTGAFAPSASPVPVSGAMAPPGVGGPVPMAALTPAGGAMAAPTAANPRGGVI